MKKSELIGALPLAGLGIFIIHQALQMDYVSEYGPGPGFLPLWLGLGITAFSALLIATILWQPSSRGVPEGTLRETGRPLAAWVAFMTAIVLLGKLGFVASFTILTGFLVFVMDRRPLPVAVGVAAGTALGLYLIFSLALRVPLPAGPWGF